MRNTTIGGKKQKPNLEEKLGATEKWEKELNSYFHRGDAEARSKAKPLKHGGTEEAEEKTEEYNNGQAKAKNQTLRKSRELDREMGKRIEQLFSPRRR